MYQFNMQNIISYFDFSIMQFISIPFLFHLYRRRNHWPFKHIFFYNNKNNNNYFTPIYKNTKLDKQLYIDCYKDKLDKMYIEYRNSSLEKYSNDFQHLNNTFIIEYTPKGNVIMKYNYDNNSIDYYCDNSISNDIIRTVFQKFTIVNH